MPGSVTTPELAGARALAPARVVFRVIKHVDLRIEDFSRLNGWPVHSPINASPPPSQMSPHDSGASVVRYTFTARDFHSLLFAGFADALIMSFIGYFSRRRARGGGKGSMPMIGVVRAHPHRAVMKRDMELARTIMLRLEAIPENSCLSAPAEDLGLTDHPVEKVRYHLKLLVGAGFLDGEPYLSGEFGVKAITWRGHEFWMTPAIRRSGRRQRSVPGVSHMLVSGCCGSSLRQNSR